jgi:hypothetical protein
MPNMTPDYGTQSNTSKLMCLLELYAIASNEGNSRICHIGMVMSWKKKVGWVGISLHIIMKELM